MIVPSVLRRLSAVYCRIEFSVKIFGNFESLHRMLAYGIYSLFCGSKTTVWPPRNFSLLNPQLPYFFRQTQYQVGPPCKNNSSLPCVRRGTENLERSLCRNGGKRLIRVPLGSSLNRSCLGLRASDIQQMRASDVQKLMELQLPQKHQQTKNVQDTWK